MKVMIVDDAMFMRMMLRKYVERAGHEVAGEAEDGQEAVSLYKQIRPDVVTMDITMPNMDGIMATKEIIAIDPNAKILIISAMGQESMMKSAILAGAYDFVVKPLEEDRLLEALSKVK